MLSDIGGMKVYEFELEKVIRQQTRLVRYSINSVHEQSLFSVSY